MGCRGLILGISILLVAQAAAWGPENFPNPKRDVNLCGRRGRSSNICDPDEIISFKQANIVEGILKDIWDGVDPYVREPCGNEGIVGYQVAVALMRRMDINPGEDTAAAARRIAKALHARWGVGEAACDNGVLLLLAVDDHQVYISTGKGAQKALSDNSLGNIISAMRPLLRKEEYGEAVEQAVVDIGLGLAGKPPAGREWELFPIIFFGVVGFLMLRSCWSGIRQRRQWRDCRNALQRVKDEQHKLRTREWSKPRTCPVCLEEFSANAEADPTVLNPPSAPPDPIAEASAPLLSDFETGAKADANGASTSAAAAGATSAPPAAAAAPCCSKKSGSADAAAAERVPITLRCGHTFCEPCLEQWLGRAPTCPICRERVDQDGGDASAAARPPTQPSQQPRGGYLDDNLLNADLAFRLMMLQSRFPMFITPGLVDNWSREARANGTFDWESAREFQLNNPAMQAQHESRGYGGNSVSFGGGGGGGGGGAGGSW